MLANCSGQIPTANQENESASTSKELLLEVYTKSEGMTHPRGVVLDIRLYSNGEAEFGYYMTPARNQSTTKTIKLPSDDFVGLKALIESEDLLNAKDFYGPTVELSDAMTTTTVRIKRNKHERKIVLHETDTGLHLDRKKAVYPVSLIKLLSLIEEMKNKYASS